MKYLLPVLSLLLPAACGGPTTDAPAALEAPRAGTWRATLQLPRAELPFLLDVEARPDSTPLLTIRNGAERLPLERAERRGDSLVIPMHIFDARIVAHVAAERMTG
ncbi:MAG: TlpA family protein disulfide reductase, partial [Catalinimonas sp.]